MASPDASNVSGPGLEDHDFAGWVGYYGFTPAGTIDKILPFRSSTLSKKVFLWLTCEIVLAGVNLENATELLALRCAHPVSSDDRSTDVGDRTALITA